jgi:hypothetical protein
VATVTIDSVPALYSGSSATVAITVTNDTVWQMGLHGVYITSGVGTGASQNVVFTPSASHVGSGNLTLLGEGNGDYESAYVYHRGVLAVLGSGQGTRSTDTGDDYTVSYTCHAGTSRKLIVFVCARATGAPTIGGVTYAGEAMTLVDSQAAASGTAALWAYYLDEASMPASGAANVVVDVTNTHLATWIVAVELDGALQGAPDAAAKAADNTVGLTTETTNSYIVSCVANMTTDGISPGEGGTELQEVHGDGIWGAAGWELIASPGAETAAWGATPTNPMLHAMAIAPGWV